MNLRPLASLWILGLALAPACAYWLEPLPDTPENLRLAVVTISLKENAESEPYVSEEAAEEVVLGASDFWAETCGISLLPVAHFEADAGAEGLPYRAINDGAIEDLQNRFAHDNYVTVVFARELRHDEDEQDFVGGIANYPWGPREAILMAGAYKNIFAHELGHFFGLEHSPDDPWEETAENDPWNLMFPGDFGDSVERNLVPIQCDEAKDYLLSHASLRPLCRPDSPDEELSAANCPSVIF